MTAEVIATIIISSFGGLVLVMAAIIKGMVSDKLKDLQVALSAIKTVQDDLRDDLHSIDLRLVKLEVEHDLSGDK